MASLLSLAVTLQLVSLATSNPVAPVVTAPARLRRQDTTDPAWIGWLIESTSGVASLNWNSCRDNQAFYTSGTFGECCDTTSSGWETECGNSINTGCSDTTVLYKGGGTQVCDSTDLCNADTVFTGSTQDASAILWYGCNAAQPRLYYQQKPLEAATITSGGAESTSLASTTAKARSSSATVARETSSSTSSSTPAPQKESSKAWIAGVVVGGLALIAIAGLAFYLLKMRKKNQGQPYQPAPQVNQMNQPYAQYPEGYASPPNSLSPNPLSPPVPYQDQKGYYAHNMAPQDSQWQHNANTNAFYPQEMPGSQPGQQPPSTNPVSELPASTEPASGPPR